jgi:IMP dehydrogenase
MREAITFDDVLIVPRHSNIPTRADIDISSDFIGEHFKLPIISANMDFVTEFKMASAMLKGGGFYVLHRFGTAVDVVQASFLARERLLSISEGVRNPEISVESLKQLTKFISPDRLVVTIDVAHGHHQRVYDLIQRIRDEYGWMIRIIAGNVATVEGFAFLAKASANAIKVGIGPGAACTTREVTGIGVPQLTAIMDCAQVQASFPNVDLIADGGIKNSGDIVKALAAGADMVMLGSLLAGTDEAPGERRVDRDGTVWRPYRGQSIFGTNAQHYTVEGVEGWVKNKGPVADILAQLAGGIRSGLSYVGAHNLSELRAKAEFVRVSPGTHAESATRVHNPVF